MPYDVANGRQIQGRFHHQVVQNLQRGQASAARLGLTGRGPLQLRNGRDGLVQALLLSAALAQLRPVREAVRPQAVAAPAWIPGAAAGAEDGYRLMGGGETAHALHTITNAAAAGCVARPAHCPQTLAAAAVSSAGMLAAGGLGYLMGRSQLPSCRPEPASPPSTPMREEAVMQVLSTGMRERVWDIVRACDGVTSCAVPRIHTLLAEAPADVQQRLLQLLPVPAEEGRPSGLPGAHAAVLPPGTWLDHLANVLGTQIGAEQAAFELDLMALVDATLSSQSGYGADARTARIGVRRHAANQARRDAIVRLCERDGYTVERRPFNLSTHTAFGFPFQSAGESLQVTLSGEGPVRRTLLLMAHGDMTAVEQGSTGALDNGAGVAALLALGRRLRAGELPPGTQVRLLVTDREEMGLHGAKAYAEQCQAAADCPDVTLNLDLLGNGAGLALSGSADHVHYRDGDSLPRGADATPVTPREARMDRWLRAAAAASGITVYDTAHWTLQSDHIAFQRRALPAIGISQMDADDIALERTSQQAYATALERDEAVDWGQYESYENGTLDAARHAQMAAALAASDAAWTAYREAPMSQRLSQVHSRSDQPEGVDARGVLSAVDVLHQAVGAWLADQRDLAQP